MAFSISWIAIIAAVISYALLCRTQRHKQRHAVEARYYLHRGHDLAAMTLEDAWEMQTWLAEQEFPKTLSTGVFFALFKTYGIPSIAKVLTATGHMTSSLLSLSRRTADTGQLLNNVIIAPPKSKRSIDAVVRTAWIHRGFRQSGKITNADMLFTLSLFALEGKRWVNRYEWRSLTELECCAIGVFWRRIGRDLDIDDTDLGTSPHASGLEWHQALDRWSCAYEKEHMAPDASNHALAVATLRLLGAGLPSLVNDFAGAAFCHLMGSELRQAMSMPTPPPLTATLVDGLLQIRIFVLRHLSLPRSKRSRKEYIAASPSESDEDRYHALRYRAYPWYVKANTSSRFKAWVKGQSPPGPRFQGKGYKILELGPNDMKGKGEDEMAKMAREIRVTRGME